MMTTPAELRALAARVMAATADQQQDLMRVVVNMLELGCDPHYSIMLFADLS